MTMGKVCVGGRAVEVAAVLFDKDCTLLDSLSYWPRLAENRVERLRQSVAIPNRLVPALYHAIGVTLPDRRPIPKSPLVLGPRRDTMVAVATVLFLEGMAWDQALDQVKQAFLAADAQTEEEGGAPAFAEARPLLAALRRTGIRVGVLTNDDRARSIGILAKVGLGELVAAVAGGDEVHYPKPDPELLHLLCGRLEVAPGEVAVVGDALSDVRMGRAAGAALIIGVATGSATREELTAVADVVVGSLGEIGVENDAA
jgi:phosphoglycolate phosphatase